MNKLYKNKIPDPGEHFNYVVTKADADFDLSGKRLHPTKGDLMEFVDVAKELEKELDYLYYLRDDIIGLCARFIMYDDRYQPPSSDKIMELEDSDKKYKEIDIYSQNKAKKWLEEYVNELNGVTPKMISSCGPAYKRAYKNSIKIARVILHQDIDDSYEIFHGNWLSFEYFKVDNPVEILWERFIEYAKSSTQYNETSSAKNISVNDKIKESICNGFVKHLDTLIKIIEKYDTFFHKLVYHMRYKEHISISEKIGTPETMRKNEMIISQPILPHISESNQAMFESFRNTWYKGLELIQTV
nr:4073_t:CDS:1 [Entrophospora candida]